MQTILEKCGFEETKNKVAPPSTIMSFLGVLFNTERMTIKRLQKLKVLLVVWINKNTTSLKDLKSLLGKLNVVAARIRPRRIFISRMLKWLKVIYKKGITTTCFSLI